MTHPTTLFAAWLALLASFVLTHCGQEIEPPDSMSRVSVTVTAIAPVSSDCDGRHCVVGGLR